MNPTKPPPKRTAAERAALRRKLAQSAAHPAPHPEDGPLEMHRRAIELRAQATLIPQGGPHKMLLEQLDRSTLLIVLCLGESAKRSLSSDKLRYNSLARGYVTKAVAATDALRHRNAADPGPLQRIRYNLILLQQSLTRLCAAPSAPRRPSALRPNPTLR